MPVDADTLKGWLELIAKSENVQYAAMAQMALSGHSVENHMPAASGQEVEIDLPPTVFFFGNYDAYYCTKIKKKGNLITCHVENGNWPMIYNSASKTIYFNYNGAGMVIENVAGFNKEITFELVVDQDQVNAWFDANPNYYGPLNDNITKVIDWAWYVKDNLPH